MDIVYIRDLQVETIIGIYDWEREVRQTISIDLDMAANISKAARSDNIEDALNYKAVAKRLISFIESSSCLLVERLAEEVAQIVVEEFNVPWVKLRLSKPGALRGSRDVGLIIERGEKLSGPIPDTGLDKGSDTGIRPE
jgi:dihydroneopterin aldolase